MEGIIGWYRNRRSGVDEVGRSTKESVTSMFLLPLLDTGCSRDWLEVEIYSSDRLIERRGRTK